MSIEFDLLYGMFKGDLDIAAQFARIGHLTAARQHLQSAAKKLDQIERLPAAAIPRPEAPAIDV